MPEMLPSIFLAIQQLLSDEKLVEYLKNELLQVLIYRDDFELRHDFGKYLQIYIKSSDNMARLTPILAEIDSRLALMKFFVVVGLPQPLFLDDRLRNLFDWDVGEALFRSSTLNTIISCESKTLCDDERLIKAFNESPPFWFVEKYKYQGRVARLTEFSPLEMFATLLHESVGSLNLKYLAGRMETY